MIVNEVPDADKIIVDDGALGLSNILRDVEDTALKVISYLSSKDVLALQSVNVTSRDMLYPSMRRNYSNNIYFETLRKVTYYPTLQKNGRCRVRCYILHLYIGIVYKSLLINKGS